MANAQHNPDEVAKVAADLYENRVPPKLRAEDDRKFVAIDVLTGDFELEDDDYSAVMNLRGRRPEGELWLGGVGARAAYHMRRSR